MNKNFLNFLNESIYDIDVLKNIDLGDKFKKEIFTEAKMTPSLEIDGNNSNKIKIYYGGPSSDLPMSSSSTSSAPPKVLKKWVDLNKKEAIKYLNEVYNEVIVKTRNITDPELKFFIKKGSVKNGKVDLKTFKSSSKADDNTIQSLIESKFLQFVRTLSRLKSGEDISKEFVAITVGTRAIESLVPIFANDGAMKSGSDIYDLNKAYTDTIKKEFKDALKKKCDLT